MNLFEKVKDFHWKFGLTYHGDPRQLPDDTALFRIGCLKEEIEEYEDAVAQGDLAGQLDALVDLVYFALGTADLHGFDFNEAFKRVHAANMLKIRASRAADSKRGSEFDVVKPENWHAPDLADLVMPKEQD